MTRFIAIVSGKGGVGKTTTAINLGVSLNRAGVDTILVDASLQTPDIGINLGSINLPVTLHEVLSKGRQIHEAIYQHQSGLKIIPGNIRIPEEINTKNLKKSITKLRGAAEIVLIDLAAGFPEENIALMEIADEILIVTNPNLASVTNTLKSIKIAEEMNKTILGVVLNRTSNNLEMQQNNIHTMLGIPIISEIPESIEIKESQQQSQPVTFLHPGSAVSESYKNLAWLISGKK